jgi:hypothetical protein
MRWGIAACPPSEAGGNWAATTAGVGKVATAGSANAPTSGEDSTVVRSVGMVRGDAGVEHVQGVLPRALGTSSVDLWQQLGAAAARFAAWQQVPNSVPPWKHARSGWGAARATTSARNSSGLAFKCIVRPLVIVRGSTRSGSGEIAAGFAGESPVGGTFHL